MRSRSIFAPSTLVLTGALALGACTSAPRVQQEATGAVPPASAATMIDDPSAADAGPPTEVGPTGTVVSPPTELGTAGPVVNAPKAPAPTPAAPKAPPSSNPTNPGGGQTGNPPGGGAGPGNAPAVTTFQGPANGANCLYPNGSATFGATYTVANAHYVEYLLPGLADPTRENAVGTVQLKFDCSQTSQVFKLRAVDELSGTEAKNPSPYVSITVNRSLSPYMPPLNPLGG